MKEATTTVAILVVVALAIAFLINNDAVPR